MLFSLVFFFLTLFLLISEAVGGKLQIVEAGWEDRYGRKYGQILPVTQFCPQRFSSLGFSILCIPTAPYTGKMVVFKVNGAVVNRETEAPFAISGDIGDTGRIRPWGKYSWSTASPQLWIRCENEYGNLIAQAKFKVDCQTTYTKAHSRALPAPQPKPQPKPAPQPKWPVKAGFRSLTSAPSQPQHSTGALGVSRDYCVTKRAEHFMGGKPKDWTFAPGGGLTYKAGDMDHSVDSPRRAILKYDIWVPRESHYAIAVEMKTRHGTEHNDVWFTCDQYLSLRKGHGNARTKAPGEYIKVYHNENGRSKKSLTVDFDGHSISTKYKLKPNTRYSCSIGGRSSRTTVHGIILFPCEDQTCHYRDEHWKKYLGLCHIN